MEEMDVLKINDDDDDFIHYQRSGDMVHLEAGNVGGLWIQRPKERTTVR